MCYVLAYCCIGMLMTSWFWDGHHFWKQKQTWPAGSVKQYLMWSLFCLIYNGVSFMWIQFQGSTTWALWTPSTMRAAVGRGRWQRGTTHWRCGGPSVCTGTRVGPLGPVTAARQQRGPRIMSPTASKHKYFLYHLKTAMVCSKESTVWLIRS